MIRETRVNPRGNLALVLNAVTLGEQTARIIVVIIVTPLLSGHFLPLCCCYCRQSYYVCLHAAITTRKCPRAGRT